MKNDDDQGIPPQPFSFAMPPFDPNRAKLPSSFVGIPQEFLILIGHVVAAWSQFDMFFNQLLGRFLTAVAAGTDRWELAPFKKRSTRLRLECQARFADHKCILASVAELVADARRLQTDRNLITHGHVSVKVQTLGVVHNQIQGALSLHCVGTEARKRLEREYSLEDLERLRYEFAYLCGRTRALLKGENLHNLQFTPADTHALQSFLATHSPTSAQADQ